MSHASTECLPDADPTGLNYWGTLSMTISGKACQFWRDEHPHKHHYTHLQGELNYCRNRFLTYYLKNQTSVPVCYHINKIWVRVRVRMN